MPKAVKVIPIILLTCAFTPILCAQSPLATEQYVPISAGGKAGVFFVRTIAPHSIAKSAFMAEINQLQDSPEEWDEDLEGYFQRFGHKLAIRGVQNGIGLLVAIPLQQDPRYFYSGVTGLWPRSRHAVISTFVSRSDSGGRVPSVWRFAGYYGAQFVSNSWRPERQRTASDTLVRGTVSLGYAAATNVFKEFWPDIRRRVFKR